ncbi:acetyl-CoA carboxylase biotin carboxyl carrier protein [Salinibacillus xinjiangensis]|uniref:Biotin carboxyl carrier protein of acetyl-CoA carboxylase n=1 Tax=Salinibacillus xinjiangensis TaxID=1229268 RepID=A0A6G1X6P1_9BACI|nr:acetyl-CoA carboxylase biotin carboxyl carrier protein [Salinibacillus xinjiangensis]MRG86550.1 acetyl-CoA carboxylase biotin carboxyl carrier protein [Salinibacillus xinjiangensis]
MLKVQEIRELIKLIDESSIDEFKYESDGTKVNLKKQVGGGQVVQSVVERNDAVVQEKPAPKVANEEEKPQPKTTPEEKSEEEKSVSADYDKEITSPMVGTFYRSPAPDKDPYVQVGDNVKADSVVCIVEAMKLFNEIEAEVNGEIVEILVEDGELVEYGQPLFRVKSK